MTQTALFLLLVVIVGIYTLRWSLRLAPLTSELPLKTLTALLLAGAALVLEGLGRPLTGLAGWLAVVGAPLFVAAPLAAVGLARTGRFGVATALRDAFYWTEPGRRAVGRLLAQVALQRGEAETALALSGDDPLVTAQAYAQQRRWTELLTIELPDEGDNAFLAEAARVEALIELDRLDDASQALQRLRERHEGRAQGPLGYRSVQLSEARLAAARGDLEGTQEVLRQPLPGVPAHLLYGLLARAAERSGRVAASLDLYGRAYAAAPAGYRPRYAAPLERHGRPLPRSLERRVALGTYVLLAVLVAAYGGQLWLEAVLGPTGGSQAAGFLVNLGGVPGADAWWRYLSYAFVHGGLIHIGLNAWVLFDIGRIYEARRGWGNLLAAFTLGTAMGAYLTVVAQGNDQLVLVGASGGILGIAGALLADALRGRAGSDRGLTRALLQWMGLIVLISVAIPNVSLWGHVGGVVGGMLWGFIRQGLPLGRRLDLFVGGVSIGLLAYAVVQVVRVVLVIV